MAECLVWHVDSETWRNAYMQVCTRAKMQKCKIANVLSCTISLGSERPKRYFRRAVQATRHASLEFRQATKGFLLVRLR